MPSLDRYYSDPELAREMGVKPRTTKSWRDKRTIVTQTALNTWLACCTITRSFGLLLVFIRDRRISWLALNLKHDPSPVAGVFVPPLLIDVRRSIPDNAATLSSERAFLAALSPKLSAAIFFCLFWRSASR